VEPKPAQYTLAEKQEIKGLKNVGKIAPGIYRGAQPTEAGLDTLKQLGVKTIINLRHFHGHEEEKWCQQRGLDYVWIMTETTDEPTDAHVKKFLEIVTDPKRQPVYFHCKYGQDRTGTMCAAYRLAVDSWPLADALKEMDAFGFNKLWHELREYVEGLPARTETIWPKHK
jgi:protein tyrosine/serine phosphatase